MKFKKANIFDIGTFLLLIILLCLTIIFSKVYVLDPENVILLVAFGFSLLLITLALSFLFSKHSNTFKFLEKWFYNFVLVCLAAYLGILTSLYVDRVRTQKLEQDKLEKEANYFLLELGKNIGSLKVINKKNPPRYLSSSMADAFVNNDILMKNEDYNFIENLHMYSRRIKEINDYNNETYKLTDEDKITQKQYSNYTAYLRKNLKNFRIFYYSNMNCIECHWVRSSEPSEGITW